MKKTAQLLCLFCAAVLMVSCSEDEPDYTVLTFQEENPYPDYLQHYAFDQNQIAYVDDNNAYEMGFSFKPTAKGNITSLVVTLPDAHADLRVTIWDEETAIPIRTVYLDVHSAATEMVFPIDPLALETDHQYMITMNSDDYYMYFSQTPEPPAYPFHLGNISITGSGIEMSNQGQTMPLPDLVNAATGQCSFKFQRTE